MAEDYTPSMDTLRGTWVESLFEGIAANEAHEDAQWDADRMGAQFDRAIAAHDAEVREAVAKEIRTWARNIHPDTSPVTTNSQAETFLENLAAAIARGVK